MTTMVLESETMADYPATVHTIDLSELTLGRLPESNSRREVVQIAADLADRVREATGQARTRTINPLLLAASVTATVLLHAINRDDIPRDSPDWISAAILRKPGAAPQVVLERNDSPQRRRFSLAHEIAHVFTAPVNGFVADERRPARRPEDDMAYFMANRREYFADLFSHFFLLPACEFDPLVDAGMSDEDIAMYMKVSVRTVVNRRMYRAILSGQVAD